MPPALATCCKKLICSCVARPVSVLTSIAVNTAIVCPACSGFIVILVHPITSDDPTVSPNLTGTALLFREDHATPTLFLNTVAKREAASRTDRRMLDSVIGARPRPR